MPGSTLTIHSSHAPGAADTDSRLNTRAACLERTAPVSDGVALAMHSPPVEIAPLPSRANRILPAVCGLVVVVVSIPVPAGAHTLGGLSNLPAPLSYFLAGVATFLIAGSMLLSARWTRPRWQAEAPTIEINIPGWRRIVAVLRAIGVGGLVLVIATGVGGVTNSVRNPGPVLVWVAFWLVVPFTGALLGDLYRLLNPWRTLSKLLGAEASASRHPTGLWGVWPAAAALALFVWFELVFPNPAHPRHLAIAAVVYTVILLGIGERVGRNRALEQFDAFTTYNRLISAIGPFDLDPERGPGWRGWLRRLPGLPELPGVAGFVVLMIGAVAFHGMSTASWFESAFGGFGRSPGGRTLLLAMTVAMVGTAYWTACRLAARQAGANSSTSAVAGRFSHCLVPIAFAFLFAHYFTVVVFEGQLLGSTVSDPFSLGWNLLGMAGRPVDFTVLTPIAVWWIQVASIASGHAAALLLVHDRSLADFGPAGVRRGYPFVALVIVLAWAGLTILAAG
jgi:hypothetical protein